MLSAALYAHVQLSLAQSHMRPRVQRASGIPCALWIERARSFWQTSGATRRENAKPHPRRPGEGRDPYAAAVVVERER